MLTYLHQQCTHGGINSLHCCDLSVERCGLAEIHSHGDRSCHGDKNHDLVIENGPIAQLQFCPLPAQEDR